MKKNNLKVFYSLFVFFLIITTFLIVPKSINAYCNGIVICEEPNVCCSSQGIGCSNPRCTSDYGKSCSGGDQQSCTDMDSQCGDGENHIGGSCTWTQPISTGCPSGQIFCAGCINGCKDATQTCNDWILQECSTSGTPPPYSTPPPSQSACNTACDDNTDCQSGQICTASGCWHSGCPGSSFECEGQLFTNLETGERFTNEFTICSEEDNSYKWEVATASLSYLSFTVKNPDNELLLWVKDRPLTNGQPNDLLVNIEEIFKNHYQSNLSQGDTLQFRSYANQDDGNGNPGIESGCGNWTITNQCNTNDSICSDYSFPTEIFANETQPVSMTYRNTGTNTWNPEGSYRLGSQNPSDNSLWGTHRVYLPAGTQVPFTTSHTFAWDITAPNSFGEHSSKWQTVKDGPGGEWFGQTCGPDVITVQPGCATNIQVECNQASDAVSVSWNAPNDNTNKYILRANNEYQNNAQCQQDGVNWVGWYCEAEGDQYIALNGSGNGATNSWNINNIEAGVDYALGIQSVGTDHLDSTKTVAGCEVTTVFNCAPCEVSCTEDCGTGNTLAGTPTTPSTIQINNQTSGAQINLTTDNTPNLTWQASSITAPATINGYQVWIWDRNENTNRPATCTTATDCVERTTTNPYIMNLALNPVHSNQVAISIRAYNNTCGTIYSDWSTTATFDFVADVSGSIYETSVTANPLTNNCLTPGTATTVNISSALDSFTTTATGNHTITPPGSTYSITNIPYAPSSAWGEPFDITLALTNTASANSFFCTCPNSQSGSAFDCTQTDTVAPSSSQNFHVTSVDLSNSRWWQTAQGNVYAALSYASNIPDSCETAPSCNANFITQNPDSDSKSAGIPMSGGAAIDVNGYYTQYNQGDATPTQPRALSTQHSNMVIENFDYLVREIDINATESLPTNPTSLPTAGTTYGDAVVYYAADSRVFDFTTTQTIAAGTKVIYFVDGDITFEWSGAAGGQLIDVAEGGYVAFIANGDIIFDHSIGNVLSYPAGGVMNTNIAGVFVADDNLIVASDNLDDTKDRNFVGEGTFVGWSGITLERTYDNTTNPLDRAINNEYPTELFIFRPDFNTNTPQFMLQPSLVWQEVN